MFFLLWQMGLFQYCDSVLYWCETKLHKKTVKVI